MFSKYFSLKYFAYKYFDRGSYNPASYTNSGDIQTLIGSEQTVIRTTGDVWATVLKRPAQVRVAFSFDIQTETT
jgi:hypothetical protein